MLRRRRLPPSSLVDYGIVGDLHTCALVSTHGAVDWLCWPRLDSPSVFGALLDDAEGGRLRVAPQGGYRSSQQYEPRTNILRTEFVTPSGEGTLLAFMPVTELDGHEYGDQELHLEFHVTKGSIDVGIEFSPRLHYGTGSTVVSVMEHGAVATRADEHVSLSCRAPLSLEGNVAVGSWIGAAGDRLGLCVRYGEPMPPPYDAAAAQRKHHRTSAFWEGWSARGRIQGPWAPAVLRSALTLRLLTYAPTGAMAAAATTSLPEEVGGVRNWDYRFSWVRDSAFTVRVLHSLGYSREARRYLRWLRRLLRGTTGNIGQLQVCYGLEGEVELPEMELPHWSGYRDSRPVRVGNEAAKQFQLDIFGSLADAIYLAYHTPDGHPDEAWRGLQAIADHVRLHWREPDHGIWEVRGPKRRYTHSALMSWVALDRAARVAGLLGRKDREAAWRLAADEIRSAILDEAWDPAKGSFTQALGEPELDAAVLMMPIVGFLPPDDARMRSTVDRVRAELGVGPYVYRYAAPDGLAGQEGAFLMCSFWMVQCLAMMGEEEEARARFDALSRLAGPLGLFCEEVDPHTHEPLGNFPQALTHLSHVEAALSLRPGPVAERPEGGIASPARSAEATVRRA